LDVPSDSRRLQWQAYAALAAAIAGISWSAIFVRWAGIPGVVSAFYRVVIAAAVLVPATLLRGSPDASTPGASVRKRADRPAVALAVAGGVFFAFDLALWNTAVMRTDAAVASLLGNNTPIFVGLLTWLFLRRRPAASFWAGLGLALVGCVFIATADLRHAGAGARGNLTGDALALVASVFFAAYLTVTERIRASLDTLTFSTLAIGGSVVTLAVVCLALRVPLWGFPARTWWALAGLGLVSQLGAYFALVAALGRLRATVTSVGLLAQVPCTAVLAAWLLGEPLSSLQLAGGAVVLAGIFVVNRGGRA
jgi:drug/metabolite transporter (DMT)-like permease